MSIKEIRKKNFRPSMIAYLFHALLFSSLSLWITWNVWNTVIVLEIYNLFILTVFSLFMPSACNLFPKHVQKFSGSGKHEPPTLAILWHFFQTNLIIVLCFVLCYPRLTYPSKVTSVRTLLDPFWWTSLCIEMVLCYLVFEILEYFIHQGLHLPFIYSWIHKRHHQSYATMSITGFYMHPLDVICQLVLPTFIPVFLIPTCIETIVCFFAIAYFFVHTGHSGYKVTYFFNGEYHYVHHRQINKHYAAIEPFFITLAQNLLQN